MKLVIVRGAPGSGKSTFVKNYINNITDENTFVSTAHFEADMYFMLKGEYHFNPTLLRNAHDWCKENVEESMGEFTDFVFVSNTFTKLWEMEKYLELAEKYRYDVSVYHLTSQYNNVHGVPEEVVQRMLDTYQPYEGEIEVC